MSDEGAAEGPERRDDGDLADHDANVRACHVLRFYCGAEFCCGSGRGPQLCAWGAETVVAAKRPHSWTDGTRDTEDEIRVGIDITSIDVDN
jgi:hypothetical protein